MARDRLDIEPIGTTAFVIRAPMFCNIGVYTAHDAALIIDSGYLPRVAAEIRDTVREHLGYRVELLFNTHYHSDHTFGNQSFDCPILASRRCAEMMQSCLDTHWSDDEIAQAKREDPALVEEWRDLTITLPTTTFEDSLEYDFQGQKMIFRRFGGHSPDSSVLYIPGEKLLFAGDIVFAGRYPTILPHDSDPVKLVEVLKELTLYDTEAVIPGHGITCGTEALQTLIEYWECLLSSGRDARRSGKSRSEATEELTDRCHLAGIPFDRFRHQRNITSVLQYLEKSDATSA